MSGHIQKDGVWNRCYQGQREKGIMERDCLMGTEFQSVVLKSSEKSINIKRLHYPEFSYSNRNLKVSIWRRDLGEGKR